MEIAVFVVVGRQIGVLTTLALVLLTAVAGSILMRIQGFGMLARMQRELAEGRLPGRELVHGVMILVAGILLLLPGFVSDLLGLLLFIPPVRDAVWAFLRSRVVVIGPDGVRRGQRQHSPRETTIDLGADEYSESGEKKSPWSKLDDGRE